MSITPVANLVLVEPIEITQSAGGLFLPGNPSSNQATVISLGSGIGQDGETVTFFAAVGDTVLLRDKCGFQEIDVNGKKLRLVSNTDIIAVII